MPYEWLQDSYWLSAARWTADFAGRFAHVLTPYDFAGAALPSLPLEFSEIVDPAECLVIMAMDDVDRLSLEWVKNIRSFRLLASNGVFVALTANRASALLDLREEKSSDLDYLYKKAGAVLNGVAIRSNAIDEPLSDLAREGSYVLMICASQTDNAGDRLIASEAAGLLRESWTGCAVVVSSPAVDRSLIAGASAVVLGPGGFVYDQHVGQPTINLQNIANYFRFGFVAKDYRKPLFLLGVGHQGLVSDIGRDFVRAACAEASLITCRDRETVAMMSSLCPPGRPLIFHEDFSELAGGAIRQKMEAVSGQRTILICGDFGDATPALLKAIQAANPPRITFAAQATEDLNWFARHREQLADLVREIDFADVRRALPNTFIDVVTASSTVLTTRLHTAKIALLAGLDVAVIAHRGDKRDRLFRERAISGTSSILYSEDAGAPALTAALTAMLISGNRHPAAALASDLQPFEALKDVLRLLSPIEAS